MHIKIYYFKNLLDYMILFFQFFIGVYIALIRLNNPEAFYIDDLYFYAREGLYLDLSNNLFDVQVMMSVLDLLIILPVVCGKFTKNYNKKCCYIATRYNSFGKFYLNEAINIALACFLYELFYCAGILACAIIKSNFLTQGTGFFILFVQSVVNSVFILFTFVALSILLSSINEKISVSITLTAFIVLTVLIFILPNELKQFNIVSLYFVGEMNLNKQIFTYPIWVYYALLFILDTGLIGLGYFVLRKKDVL
ncbi:MAG: hypothetical protein ACI4XC_08860 [Eubacterium sp.]